MPRIQLTTSIAASPVTVFAAISHPEAFARVVPDIVKVEILSDVREGAGLRFRETRTMRNREVATVLQITEHVPDERVRYVSEMHGTVWDTIFRIHPSEEGSRLETTMTVTSAIPLAGLMNRLMMGMVKNAIAKDMAATKSWCERHASA